MPSSGANSNTQLSMFTPGCALTIGLSLVIGHWALLVPVLLGAAGATFHIVWCRQDGIDPVRATLRRRNYELRTGHGHSTRIDTGTPEEHPT